MITIENEGPFKEGIAGDLEPSNYTLVIKGRELCSFKHRRIDGLGKCLLEAARAFEESEAERIRAEAIVEPRTLRPFVKAIWGNGFVSLDFKVPLKSEDEIPRNESHSCHDLEAFLRCLLEMRDRKIEDAKISFH
jgi:hypothetical protein